jgi:hypothetical protein
VRTKIGKGTRPFTRFLSLTNPHPIPRLKIYLYFRARLFPTTYITSTTPTTFILLAL